MIANELKAGHSRTDIQSKRPLLVLLERGCGVRGGEIHVDEPALER